MQPAIKSGALLGVFLQHVYWLSLGNGKVKGRPDSLGLAVGDYLHEQAPDVLVCNHRKNRHDGLWQAPCLPKAWALFGFDFLLLKILSWAASIEGDMSPPPS